MLKRFLIALAVSAGLLSPSFGAGTISLSLSQQFDKFGHVLANCKLNLYQAGSNIPQIAYQDTALTIPVPGGAIITCDASGRLPQFFLADGNIKVLLTDANGVTQIAADNILVIGNSSGGGGGSPVDPTTILATGDMKVTYGTGTLVGFVRANGRTIGSASSGATERANADTQALFQYLWNADPNLAVSTGRGASANADWVANKQIALPDMRGRVMAGLDDMGNSAAGNLTASFFGAQFSGSPTTLGAIGGLENHRLTASELPSITSSNTQNISVGPASGSLVGTTSALSNAAFASGGNTIETIQASSGFLTSSLTSPNTISVTSSNTGNNQHTTVQPTMLLTIYQKL